MISTRQTYTIKRADVIFFFLSSDEALKECGYANTGQLPTAFHWLFWSIRVSPRGAD